MSRKLLIPHFVLAIPALMLTLQGFAQEKSGAQAQPLAGADKITLKLLDPGKEPRKPLRLALKKGLKQVSKMEMAMEIAMKVGGNPVPSPKLPTQVFAIETEVTAVSPSGDATYSFKFTEADTVAGPDVMPLVLEQVKSTLKSLIGSTGTAVVSNRGVTKESKLNLSESATPQIKNALGGVVQSLDQLSNPLPEEPVGIGAKWEVSATLEQNGVKVHQLTTYELVSLEGASGKLKMSVTQTADPQTVSAAGMPPGMVAQLKSFSSKGSGESSFDLGKIVPPSSNVSASTDMNLSTHIQGQTQEMSTHMKLDMKISDKK